MTYTKQQKEIISLVANIGNGDLEFLYDLAKKERQSRAKRDLQVGSKVTFVVGGTPVKGKVTKINRKTVKVETKTHGIWRVSPTLLSVA